ncbi:MAG: LysE family translocator [Granulosicoccus sp.]
MDWSLIAGFAAVAAVIEISPGPNFLLITRSVSTFGKSGAMANVAGFSCSYAMHGTLAIYGISAVLATEPMLLVFIQLAGACYLLYLGIRSFIPSNGKITTLQSISQPVDILLTQVTDAKVNKFNIAFFRNRMSFALPGSMSGLSLDVDIVLDEDKEQIQREGMLTCFTEGIVISALNPKITLFYMAAFPQFIQPGDDTTASSFFLVLTHIAICALWAAAIAIVLEFVLKKTGSSCIFDKVNRFSGIALIGLSAAFFSSAVRAC